jgi:hypothetical protein
MAPYATSETTTMLNVDKYLSFLPLITQPTKENKSAVMLRVLLSARLIPETTKHDAVLILLRVCRGFCVCHRAFEFSLKCGGFLLVIRFGIENSKLPSCHPVCLAYPGGDQIDQKI